MYLLVTSFLLFSTLISADFYFQLQNVPKDILEDNAILIAINSQPHLVTIIHPTDREILSSTQLPLAPLCFSVDTTAKLIAVGHDAYITIINYSNPAAPTTIGTFPTHVTASTIAIASPNVYIFPTGESVNIVCVDITGQLTKASWNIFGSTVGKIHPFQNAGYTLSRNVTPADMGKFDLANPPAKDSESPYNGEYDYGTNFWYSFDGTRVFCSSGNTFIASNDPQQDYLYQGSLGVPVLGISQENTPPNNIVGLTSGGTHYTLWTWPYLDPVANVPLPMINGLPFIGEFIFFPNQSYTWIVGSINVDGIIQWYLLFHDMTQFPEKIDLSKVK